MLAPFDGTHGGKRKAKGLKGLLFMGHTKVKWNVRIIWIIKSRNLTQHIQDNNSCINTKKPSNEYRRNEISCFNYGFYGMCFLKKVRNNSVMQSTALPA